MVSSYLDFFNHWRCVVKVVVVISFIELLYVMDVLVFELGLGQFFVWFEILGICYIDIYVVYGDWLIKLGLLFIFGYEGIGVVVGVGVGVDVVEWIGVWVVILWFVMVCG